MDAFISKQTNAVYGFMELVVFKGYPLSCCECPILRKYITLKGISRKTLMKYLHATGEAIQEKIRKKIATEMKFGLMIDGWDAGRGVHW